MNPLPPDNLTLWRREQRKRLLALREAVDAATLGTWRRAMDQHLLRGFPGLRGKTIAICWPYRNEYDARHLARVLREAGSTILLPVIVAPKTPLIFKEWKVGAPMARGPLDIPYPINAIERVPEVVLLPMLGFDDAGYRLGYGGGYFDRTLAAIAPRPVVIGVVHEFARLASIHPQPHDQPVDYVVTERGIYRRDPAEPRQESMAAPGQAPSGMPATPGHASTPGLTPGALQFALNFLGAPEPGANAELSSPVCYAAGERDT